MFYTVYKTTNQINGKFYIGCHKTIDPNDDYLGSGKILKRAIEKHGVQNFVKEVLHVFNNPEEMFAKEKEIVTVDFLEENNCYNLKVGGEGGFDFVNKNSLGVPFFTSENAREMNRRSQLSVRELRKNSEYDKRYRSLQKARLSNSVGFLGKSHSEDTKRKMSEKASSRTGSKNSSFGTKWITNGSENRKIKKEDVVPDGWYNGRTMSTQTKN